MSAEQPPRWGNVSTAPPRNYRRSLARLLAFLAIAALSWLVAGLIGASWAICSDLDVSERFGIYFAWFVMVVAVTIVAYAMSTKLRGSTTSTRVVLVLASVALTYVVAVMWFVPFKGYDDWPGGASSNASAECGPGGIPTWWPAWLPN